MYEIGLPNILQEDLNIKRAIADRKRWAAVIRKQNSSRFTIQALRAVRILEKAFEVRRNTDPKIIEAKMVKNENIRKIVKNFIPK